MDFDYNKLMSEREILEKVEIMNSFGPRLTGSPAHNDFIRYLKNEIVGMGFDVYADPYFFDRWEEKSNSLTLINEDGSEEAIHVSSAFPYSGKTKPEGITAELTFVSDPRMGYLSVKDKIAVVRINELDFLPTELAFDIRRSQPEGLTLPAKYDGPVATAFVNFPFLKFAKLAGAKAVICVWEGIDDKCIEGQYLPFILGYMGIPALWLNSTDGERVIECAKKSQKVRFVLNAEEEKHARTETFYTIMPGKNSKEAIIVNTHTDGTNCIEENGPIALLAMMRYLKEIELERTVIFVFITGHFRLPSFTDLRGGGIQATSKWLASHRDLWDGRLGHTKAVAGVSVEHLGCKMWKETEDGDYRQTGEVELELCYTGNSRLDDIYYQSLEGRTKVHTMTLRGHNFLHWGEGQPLFNCSIPEIALVTAPDCLCVVSENHEMDKFDACLMREQIGTFTKCVLSIDALSRREIGKCDPYSLIMVNQFKKK